MTVKDILEFTDINRPASEGEMQTNKGKLIPAVRLPPPILFRVKEAKMTFQIPARTTLINLSSLIILLGLMEALGKISNS